MTPSRASAVGAAAAFCGTPALPPAPPPADKEQGCAPPKHPASSLTPPLPPAPVGLAPPSLPPPPADMLIAHAAPTHTASPPPLLAVSLAFVPREERCDLRLVRSTGHQIVLCHGCCKRDIIYLPAAGGASPRSLWAGLRGVGGVVRGVVVVLGFLWRSDSSLHGFRVRQNGVIAPSSPSSHRYSTIARPTAVRHAADSSVGVPGIGDGEAEHSGTDWENGGRHGLYGIWQRRLGRS